MKLAFVTPRYGSDVVGGAELGARLLAERLARLDGWTVEVLTTCARDSWTWANDYSPGRSVENGVTVHRFPTIRERDADFRRRTPILLAVPEDVSDADAEEWIDQQGPVAPALIDAIRDSDQDLVAFTPYLYHPTVVGLPLVAERAVLHPAAHDEPAIRLPLFDRVFEAARGFAFYTEGEGAYSEERFPAIVTKPQVVVGLGIDPPAAMPVSHGIAALDGRPYLLCLGRVDPSKGTKLLASLFATYKERRPGPLALAVVGPVQRPVPEHPDIVQVGEVDEQTKWGLLHGATALVSPSAFESFSLVLFESWAAGRPVLVNARCAATLEHVTRSGGGIAFDNYAVFEAALDRLLVDDDLRASLATAGARYAESYRWPAVIERYRAFVERLASTLPADA
ncbi:MAG TPA: glycosyltransferase family 4 protein [Acidimicrobiales bacterium]|nr:glycosyltransferase family 4 protein [Acidimicrobiales bacterium]